MDSGARVLCECRALAGCSENEAGAADGDSAFIGYGAMLEEPTAWASRTKSAPWLQGMRLSGVPLGRSMNQQVRFDVSGSGRMAERDVTLETPVTVRMVNGMGRARAKQLLHGTLDVLDERDGQLDAIAWARDYRQFEAAALGGFAEDYGGVRLTNSERGFLDVVLREQARDLADNTFAWHDFKHSVIVLGPDVSRTLTRHVSTPGLVTPAEGIFAAYIVRHELEHAVTAADERPETLRWLEEGVADAMARWPGEAAATARSLGLPYPLRYERIGYFTDRGGYPEWAVSIRILLGTAGVDPTKAEQFDAAHQLLQAPMLEDVPHTLAEAIVREHGLPRERTAAIERQLLQVGGSTARARAFARRLGRAPARR